MKKALFGIGFCLMLIGGGAMDSDVLIIPLIMAFFGVALMFCAGRGIHDTV